MITSASRSAARVTWCKIGAAAATSLSAGSLAEMNKKVTGETARAPQRGSGRRLPRRWRRVAHRRASEEEIPGEDRELVAHLDVERPEPAPVKKDRAKERRKRAAGRRVPSESARLSERGDRGVHAPGGGVVEHVVVEQGGNMDELCNLGDALLPTAELCGGVSGREHGSMGRHGTREVVPDARTDRCLPGQRVVHRAERRRRAPGIGERRGHQ